VIFVAAILTLRFIRRIYHKKIPVHDCVQENCTIKKEMLRKNKALSNRKFRINTRIACYYLVH
jgi:hypothetical protein